MTYLEELAGLFQELHDQARQALEGLPEEALDWKPGEEMNSIAVLVVHLAGAERYWLGDAALLDPSGRVREQEFKAQALTGAMLAQRLSAADEYARLALARLAGQDLDSERLSPRDGRRFSLGWCLAHALEHTALHLGHLQLTRQMWDRRNRVQS